MPRYHHLTRAAALLAACLLFPGAAKAQPKPDPRAAVVTALDPSTIGAEDRAKIEAALPAEACAKPARARRLLIFDRNVGYPGHRSAVHASLALTLMGQKTGAFETVVSSDPEVFKPESLRRFDAVFLNNTVGNLFTDPALRRNLIEFVYAGGGLMGVHGTSVAFMDWPGGARETWPEFGYMLGIRHAVHRANTEHVFFNIEEPGHPLVQAFAGQPFDYRDEYFRALAPQYSRGRVRVLASIDTKKTDFSQGGEWKGKIDPSDGDYPLAWVRNYGRGRVFYTAFGHNPHVFQNPTLLKFYLAATQFALGDLPAPTTPSERLTPAVRAQEKMGWRLGMAPYTFHKHTFFESIEKTGELGLSYMGAINFQKVSKEIDKPLDQRLSDEELSQVRLKLDAAGVRLLTYYVQAIPGDEAACREVFEFGRKLGIETFISEPDPAALDMIEKFCNEYGINLAIHNHDAKGSPFYWNPANVLKVCEGRGPRVGACGDMGYWIRSGVDPIEAIRLLKGRVMTLEMHELNEHTPEGHDVPWGTGAGRMGQFIKEVHALGIQPVMFGLEYSYDFLDSMPECAQSIEFFNRISLELAK